MTDERPPSGLESLDSRQERDALKLELERLAAALEEARRGGDAVSEELRILNTERAIAKREIHILQNDIYRFKRKREEIDARLRLDLPAFQAKQETLARLAFRKKDLDAGILDLGDRVAALAARLGDSEDGILRGREQLAQLEEAKRTVNAEISGYLKKASLDREKIDEELNSVAEVFRDSVSVRDETAAVFNDAKAELDGLSRECDRLEDRIRVAEEVKLLESELARLQSALDLERKQAGAAEESSAAANGELEAQRGRLARLEDEREQATAAAAALESEVRPYEEARLAHEAAVAELEESLAAVASLEARLGELLALRVRLEQALRADAGMVAMIAGLEIALN
ncbi:MAG: hypothetical protein HQK81_12420 [Desulfovibrionaceae bacterium]|nr:hypothetical protein [Desulfovibrionaceae bacterium]MBF0514848.1 hypothetical protein [Desulfovibrionaceae bacterium]